MITADSGLVLLKVELKACMLAPRVKVEFKLSFNPILSKVEFNTFLSSSQWVFVKLTSLVLLNAELFFSPVILE